jgi:hypothetical protein
VTINRETACALYNDHWDEPFTTLEALLLRIQTLAMAGGYELCVFIDSKTQYDEVYEALIDRDFDVEHYNGGGNGILQVSWG